MHNVLVVGLKGNVETTRTPEILKSSLEAQLTYETSCSILVPVALMCNAACNMFSPVEADNVTAYNDKYNEGIKLSQPPCHNVALTRCGATIISLQHHDYKSCD